MNTVPSVSSSLPHAPGQSPPQRLILQLRAWDSSRRSVAVAGGGGGGRGGGAGAGRVTSNAGLNPYTWNPRYPDASTFQGIILWAGGTTGALAAPGTYTVRMTVGNQPAQSRSFVVKKDPRTTATNADLVAQHEFLIRVRDQVSRANDAVRTIRNLKHQPSAAES